MDIERRAQMQELINLHIVTPSPELEYLVCSDEVSPHYMFRELDGDPGRYLLCKNCNLFQPYLVQQCNECDETFIRNFKHPAYDPREPRCWDCLEHYYPNDICTLWSRYRELKRPPYEIAAPVAVPFIALDLTGTAFDLSDIRM